MKKLCLNYFLFVWVFLGLSVLFLPGNNIANAEATSTVIQANFSTNVDYWAFPGGTGGQTFTANETTLSHLKIGILSSQPAGVPGGTTNSLILNVCEVASISSTSCINTPQSADNWYSVADIQALCPSSYCNAFLDYYWTTPFNLTTGHIYYYYFSKDGTMSGLQIQVNTPDNLAGGQFIDNAGYDWQFWNYYQNTSCGDTICQTGSESCSSCPADCGTCATSMVYLFGSPNLWDNPSVYKKNQPKTFNVFWNVCSDFENINRLKLYSDLDWNFYDPGIDVIKDKTIYGSDQPCKGSLVYSNYYTGFMNNATGTAYFHLSGYDVSGNAVLTLTSNGHDWITDDTVNYIDSAMTDPLYIDLGHLPQGVQSATSTSLFYLYNFNGLNTASTTIGLYDWRHATSTGYFSSDILMATSTGFGGIVIPTPTINTNNVYKFYAITPGQPVLWSKAFTVNWSFTPQVSDVYTDYVCKPPVFDDSHICDGIDQTTSDGFTTLFGHNWGAIRCAMIYATDRTGFFFFSPSCGSLNNFKGNYDTFKKGFPFNAYFEFTGTIKSAIDTASSTGATSTIGIPFIHQNATGTNKFYIMPIISSSSASTTLGTSNNNIFRQGLIWAGWIFISFLIFLTIRKV